jgi:purine nucleosidase/pyrimidine-specific ribonucleoside hydrolase
MEPFKLIVDTDIGDDIDDAFALALILRSNEFELLGVTTVYKNTEVRATIAKHMVKLVEQLNDIIYWDYETETINGKRKIRHYSDYMADYNIATECATDFLLSSIEKMPNELTVLALGPLTNLAVAYRKNPIIFKTIKQIVMMGGQASGTFAEWNIRVDPEAADIVFSSGVPIKMIGLDVTLHCRLNNETVENFRKNDDPLMKVTASMMDIWINDNKKYPTLHDALAAASMIHECCQFDKRYLHVELQGPKRGCTITSSNRTNGEPEVEVALEVDHESFMSFLQQRITSIKEDQI